MNEIIIRNSKASAVIGLIVAVPLTLIGVFLLTREPTLINWLITLFFGVLSGICLWLYFDRRPRIIISDQGITDARTKMGLIEWQDFEAVSVVRANNTQFLQIKTKDASKYLSRMGKLQKIGSKIDQTAGLDELSINVTGLEMGAEQIAAVIVEKIQKNSNVSPSNFQ